VSRVESGDGVLTVIPEDKEYLWNSFPITELDTYIF
jgi:hypothetical protein